MITTKDLGALNELMTFENWMVLKLINYSKTLSSDDMKKVFSDMAKIHASHHKALLNYLESNK